MAKKFLTIFVPSTATKTQLIQFSDTIDFNNWTAIAVVGADAEYLHDCIDETIVGEGGNPEQWQEIVTTWHKTAAEYQVYKKAQEMLYPKLEFVVISL